MLQVGFVQTDRGQRMNRKRLLFKDFVTLQRGFDLPKSQMDDGDVPVLGSHSVIGFHSEAKVEPPGVVTGRSGTLGRVQYINQPYWPHNTVLWVRDFKGNDPQFVYYKLQTLHLERFNGGVSVPTLNRNVLDTLSLEVPVLCGQKRVASILSAYDDLIENNRRRIQLLEQAARLIYKEWFVHFRFPGHEHVKVEDGVPEGWEQKKIADVCDTVGGGTPSTRVVEYWEGDITWVVPTDVTRNDCLVLLDSERKITEKGLRESSAQLVPANTILMTSRASVGFFALMDVESCTNQGFINIIPHDEAMRMFLLFNLMSRVSEIRSNAKGTTYPEISKGRFRQMDIIVPAESLVFEFRRLAGDIIRQVRCLKQGILQLTRARDLLLPRLVAGFGSLCAEKTLNQKRRVR